MKGVVLAGGTGSRLFPLTKITNKHLLPIYDRPMIYYPIQTLVDAGIQDIMIVTGGRNSGDFLRLLANGKQFGLKHINYTYQEGEGGIADALALAEHFADGQKICVVLGDNIIEGNVWEAAERFRKQPRGAHILLKEVPDAERFGVAEVEGGAIVGIEEKPHHPKSNYAVTGIYMYDASVFDKIKTLVPSKRGELEITDVNNAYIREKAMTFSFLNGWWTDAGTFESLLRAANLVAHSRIGEGMGIAGALMSAKALDAMRRPFASFGNLRLQVPDCDKGIGMVIRTVDSPQLIDGVQVQALSLHPDDRGYFLEVQRMGHGIAADFPAATSQISAALSFPGTVKAFHYHLRQKDCWTPVKGMFQVALVDLRVDSPTFGRRNTMYTGALRPWQVLIPPGVGHGYKVIGNDDALLVYMTDRFYNPEDEGRIPYNDPSIDYDWETQNK